MKKIPVSLSIKWWLLSQVLFFSISSVCGQNSIIYNNQPAPDDIIANANYAMRRSPAMDHLFAEVRDHDADVHWEKAVGSPYLTSGFLPCKVYVGEEPAGNFYYRHNAYNDEIEIKDYPEDPKKQSLYADKRFRLIDGEKEIALKTIATGDKGYTNGYLYLLSKGPRFNLYTWTKVKFTPGTPAANSLVRATPDKFTNFIDYYYTDAAEEPEVAYLVEDRPKTFVNAFDKALETKLKAYLKENKVNLKKEEDLLQVFQFLNAL